MEKLVTAGIRFVLWKKRAKRLLRWINCFLGFHSWIYYFDIAETHIRFCRFCSAQQRLTAKIALYWEDDNLGDC